MDNLNQTSPDSSILGNCLNCGGLVRVPVRSAADSKVRCPHCSNEYRLSEILDESVPALEIVEETPESFTAPLELAEPTVIQKEDIDEIIPSTTSMMPKALLDKFTHDEILKILSYLTSTKHGE